MDSLIAVMWCPLLIIFLAVMVLMIRRQIRHQRAMQARVQAIQQAERPLAFIDHWDMRCQFERLNIRAPKQAGRGYISIAEGSIVLYERSLHVPELLRFSPAQLRWYGRPQKYTSGHNEIWLHVEDDAGWMLLKIRLYQEPMRDFVRALKAVTSPELVTAYRRRRPYIHAGPLRAQPAAQDIHGAWTLAQPIDIYLMPRFLVLLEGERVTRTIPLETVQEIGALRRLDQPRADGLVRFRVGEEMLAFALHDHEGLAQALAEAAKRTLEAPVEQKQKGKKDDDWDEE